MLARSERMAVGRKSPGTAVAFDAAPGWKSLVWSVVAYLALFSAFLGTVLLAARFQPLSTANFATGASTQSNANVLRVEYRSGGTFSLGFLLANGGPLPVKVLRIQMTGKNELLIPVKQQTASKRYAGSLGATDPNLAKFLPFTVSGGDRRWIVIRTRFGNCARFPAGAYSTYSRVLVTYTVIGFTKHAWVELPKDIRVDSPADSGCPAR
jgi:hypothetical protein